VHADHTRSVLQLAGAALCWSLAGVLIKYVATSWPGLAVAGGRGLIAALFLLATNRQLRFHFSRDQVIGAIGYAACTVTFCMATTLTSAANAILLQYTAPIWVALLGAWFLGERATRADWITIAVALGGMALFFKDSLTLGHLAGDVLAVLSGVFFAGMTIALAPCQRVGRVDRARCGAARRLLLALRPRDPSRHCSRSRPHPGNGAHPQPRMGSDFHARAALRLGDARRRHRARGRHGAGHRHDPLSPPPRRGLSRSQAVESGEMRVEGKTKR
jgi:uncharacterized membrane protein